MAYFDPPAAPNVPPLAWSIINLLVRHALTLLSGLLVSGGMLEAGQSDQFVTIALGIVAGLIGLGWSLASKLLNHKHLVQAIQAPAATVVTK